MDLLPCPDGYLLDPNSSLAVGHHTLNDYLVREEPASAARDADMFWMDHTAHPDIETLDHHLAGRLPERASKNVREHIVACEDCQRIVTARLAIKLGLVRVGPHKPIWLE